VRLARLLGTIFSISLRRGLAFRGNLHFEWLISITGVAAGLAALGIVYTRTDALGGWSLGEAIVLLGTYQVVSGMLWTFIEPNLVSFHGQVLDGELDDILLKPVPSIFLASLGTCAPLGLAQVVSGAGVVTLGMWRLGSVPSVPNALAWLLLLATGIVITWATRVLLASVTFWAPSLQLHVVYMALWQFGRYPVTIYRQPIRFSLTYLVPIAFSATAPAQALTRELSLLPILTSLTFAGGACMVARTVWRSGLRRYTSATS